MDRVVFVSWERISLVIPDRVDLEVMYKWINNVNILKFVWFIKYYTKEMEEQYLNSILDWSNKMFMIMENDTKEIIGWVWFHEYSEFSRNWTLWIALYNEDKMSKWYGSEAVKLFLKYSFEYLGLNKVKLRVFSNNLRAIKAYERCGFKIVWTLKEDTYIMWKYEDEYIMEIMRSEYNS